ncbi:MAG TPA: plastocyanin/azurin family copper-binding protein [Candidatus Micrarchaeia archaeon]|nr:plastocyanin/azurin family copper-binding protein [Candidatus Micrarchaeia archaeon]
MHVRLPRRPAPGWLWPLVPLAGLALAACGSGPIPGQPVGTATAATQPGGAGGSTACTAATAKPAVTIDATNAFKFSPASVCLKAGGTVTWKNVGNVYHTTTDMTSLAASAKDAAVPAGATGWNHPLPPAASWSLALRTPGLYKYFCVPHESLGMLAQITVAG